MNGDYTARYQYDLVGNRTYETVDGVQTAYSYNDNDWLLQTGGSLFGYDDNGNTISETLNGLRTVYRYNAQNQLVETDSQGDITQYRYNPNGIRIGKTERVGQLDEVDTHYLIDENREYAQVLQEAENGNVTVTYQYGYDLLSQTRTDANETRFFQVDGLGSTRQLTDETGQITDTYNYEAFGSVLNQTGTTENSYLYTGEQYDAGLDQYYLRARYYDQNIGRFTQMDTWLGNNHAPITLHKYVYANADPTYWTDPSGKFGLASFGTASNIRSTLATTSVRNTSSAISRAVGATLKQSGRATTKHALRVLRKCIRKQNKCGLRANILIVGYDNPEVSDHIRDVQTAHTFVLTYKPNQSGNRRWYATGGGRGGCKLPTPTGKDCDEYPFFKTKEGGPKNSMRVSLRWVNSSQNRSVGAHFGFLSRFLKKPRNRDFVVVTSNDLPTVALPAGRK